MYVAAIACGFGCGAWVHELPSVTERAQPVQRFRLSGPDAQRQPGHDHGQGLGVAAAFMNAPYPHVQLGDRVAPGTCPKPSADKNGDGHDQHPLKAPPTAASDKPVMTCETGPRRLPTALLSDGALRGRPR